MVYNKKSVAQVLLIALIVPHTVFCADPIIRDRNLEQAVALTDIGAEETQAITAHIEDQVNALSEELKNLPKAGTLQLSKEQRDKLKNQPLFWAQTEDGEMVMVGTASIINNLILYGALIGTTVTSVALGGILGTWIYSLRNNVARLKMKATKDLALRGEIKLGLKG